MKKKILSIMLSFVMMIGIMPVMTANAAVTASGTCGDNLTWTLDDEGTLTISGFGEMGGSPWYEFREEIICVDIGYGVTTISNSAFYECGNLIEVTIPETVTWMGSYAFSDCYILREIVIPDGVKRISNNMFMFCHELESITIPDSVTYIDYSAFYGCESLEDIYYNGVEKDWNEIEIDMNNEYLANATIHYTIPTSGTCGDNLTWELDGEGTLTISGTGEMYNYCEGDTTYPGVTPWSGSVDNIIYANVEDGVTSIGDSAFAYCRNLVGINIADSVTRVGMDAFWHCSSLTEVEIPDDVITIYDGAFCGCDALESISIPDGVTSIGVSAFEGCGSLTEVNIPESVASIGIHAFSNCKSLNEITIPGSVESISYGAFYGCNSLSGVTIQEGVKNIDEFAFCDCWFQELTIPGSITSICDSAFYNCENLTDVYYDGAEEEWNEILVDSEFGCLANVTIHYATPDSEETAVEMNILENSYSESADKKEFAIGFVNDIPICHTEYTTLKFGFTDGEETTYLGYSMDELELPIITSDGSGNIMLGIILNNIPVKFKDNVTLTLTNDTLE